MIDPRIALGVQPLQIQSPMQGAQQMLTLRELMMGAQAQEARRDQLRMAQAHAAQQQAAQSAFHQAWRASGGQMTPEIVGYGLRAGMSPADLQSMAGVSNWGRPKVAGQFETAGPDGRPMTMFRDEYGGTIGEGHAKPVKLQAQSLGGEVGFFNEYTGAEGAPRVAKTPEQTEVERLMLARGIKPGSPEWNSTISGVLMKKSTHAPAANTTVYTGTMVPVEGPDGKPAYAMPAKDGTYTIAPGVRPPGTSDAADKKQRRQDSVNSTAETVISMVRRAKKDVGGFTAGTGGAILSGVPGSPAYDLRATIDTIKANLGFDTLQQMRDASPTGGALGQVAVQELAMLQSTVASLDPNQSPEQLVRSLNDVEMRYNRILGIINDGKMPAGGTTGGASDRAVQQQQSFADMPDPAQYRGQVIRDSSTGVRYRSNGRSWVRSE